MESTNCSIFETEAAAKALGRISAGDLEYMRHCRIEKDLCQRRTVGTSRGCQSSAWAWRMIGLRSFYRRLQHVDGGMYFLLLKPTEGDT